MMNNKSIAIRVIVSLGLITVLGFVSYANVFDGKFIWDDGYLIKNNPLVQNWAKLPSLFVTDIGAGAGHAFNSYRPLQMLTYLVDHTLWSSDVRGFHFSSILNHVLAAWAVFGLILVLYKDRLIAFTAGAFFVVHPVHTEAVAYLSGRADSLAAIFVLLAILFYIKGLETQAPKWFAGTVAAYILALLSRENALVLPALLLLYQYSFKKKSSFATLGTLFAVSILYIVLRTTVFDFHIDGNIPETLLWQRLPGFFVAVFNYLRIIALPLGLHMEYGNTLFSFNDPRAVAGIMILAVALALIFERRKQRGPVFFGLSWFFICLLPVSNLYPINAYMAEHWLYLPSIGLFLIAAWGLSLLFQKDVYRRAALAASAVLLILWVGLTVLQNRHWKNETAFYEHTIRYARDSPRMINGLAMAYFSDGRTANAIRVYEQAIRDFPAEAFYRSNLGALYMAGHNIGKAEKLFKQAVEIDPDFANAHSNLAVIHFQRKQYQLAIKHADRAKDLGMVNDKLLRTLEQYREP